VVHIGLPDNTDLSISNTFQPREAKTLPKRTFPASTSTSAATLDPHQKPPISSGHSCSRTASIRKRSLARSSSCNAWLGPTLTCQRIQGCCWV
jgi:hypothetical protein